MPHGSLVYEFAHMPILLSGSVNCGDERALPLAEFTISKQPRNTKCAAFLSGRISFFQHNRDHISYMCQFNDWSSLLCPQCNIPRCNVALVTGGKYELTVSPLWASTQVVHRGLLHLCLYSFQLFFNQLVGGFIHWLWLCGTHCVLPAHVLISIYKFKSIITK